MKYPSIWSYAWGLFTGKAPRPQGTGTSPVLPAEAFLSFVVLFSPSPLHLTPGTSFSYLLHCSGYWGAVCVLSLPHVFEVPAWGRMGWNSAESSGSGIARRAWIWLGPQPTQHLSKYTQLYPVPPSGPSSFSGAGWHSGLRGRLHYCP